MQIGDGVGAGGKRLEKLAGLMRFGEHLPIGTLSFSDSRQIGETRPPHRNQPNGGIMN